MAPIWRGESGCRTPDFASSTSDHASLPIARGNEPRLPMPIVPRRLSARLLFDGNPAGQNVGVMAAIRLNMTNIADPAADHSERYRAALEMATYADGHDITAVSCEEHHLATNGWLPSPLVLASALAGRTTSVRISVNALLVPLYDPIRL